MPERNEIERLMDKVDGLTEQVNLMKIWQATTDARLVKGNETFTDLKDGLKGCVEKKILWAYLVGMATATGGTVAGLLKLFGG